MKYTFLTLLCSLLCFSPLSATSRAADHPDHILILFDLSHSMTRKLENMTRIEAARRVFSEVMQDIPASTVFGLRLFAHEGNRDKDMACQESELVVPLQSGGRAQSGRAQSGRTQISQIVAERNPVGQKTPLGRALSLAMDDLQGIPGSRKIILLSDGLETCDGEPEEVAQQLFDMGVPVDAIGIGDEGVVQLGGIALAGGGKFFLGSNFDSLRQALATALGAGRNVVPSATQDPPQLSELVLNVPESGAALVRVIPLPPDGETPPHQAEEEAEAEAESAQPAEPVLNLEIILDSSGSMLQRLEGRTKIAIAKQALQETAQALESELIGLAFRAYGFDTSLEKTKEASCPNTELLVNFDSQQPDQHIDQIVAIAQRLTAYGYTPIAESLRLAGSDLAPYKDQRPTILLISDGEETCGGDPVAAIEALRAAGIDVRVHVIGFDLDDKARDQLRAVAAAGQGHYYDANNYHTLIDSLRTIVDEVWEQIAEADARYTRPIEGGADFDTAVRLEPGRYTLKNHLPKGQFAYFFVPTQKGQRGVVWDTLQARALVRGRDGNVKEADYAVDGVSIHIYRPDRKKIKGRVARAGGKVGKSAMTHYMDISGLGFYFTVGDNYNAVHRDALFDLDIQEAGDRYNGMVAVDKPVSEAMALPLDEEIAAHLGLEDRADSYRITGLSSGGAGGAGGAGDDRVQIDIAFPNPEFRFHIEVYDETRGKRLKKITQLEGSASIELPMAADKPGQIIRIVDANPGLYHLFSSYTLKVSGL